MKTNFARCCSVDLFPKLSELLDRQGGFLSGGEQPMLAIARTPMSNPELLLLDEPSEGLAPLVVDHLKEQIAPLKRDGLTILLAEQNVDFSLDLADRVYVLEKGRIRYEGAAVSFREDESIRARYLALWFSGRVWAMATFTLTCPCCGGRLTIDPRLEAVVAHEPPPRARSGLGLGDAITSLQGEAAKREERFREQMKAEQNKSKVLDAKLQQALKKAKADPSKFINPMDMD